MTGPRIDPPGPLAGLSPPAPPPELRARVLDAARAALLEPPPPADPWSRVWESRSLRVAWAASVLLLLAGHALVPRVRPAAPPAVLARSGQAAEAEVAAIGRLPRLDVDARPLRAGADLPARHPAPPARAPGKETRS